MRVRRATLITFLVLGLVAAAPASAASIAFIFPSSGVPGDSVLVLGSGFGARGTAVTVCGVRARVLLSFDVAAIFVVPGGVAPGPCRVVVTNSNGRSAAVGFTIRNRPPVADAGPAQLVHGGVVTLDGTKSFDPDGQPLHYAWSMRGAPPGSTAVLSDPSSPTPSFVPDRPGVYGFSLVVADPLGLSSSASFTTVVFANAAPVIDSVVASSVTPPVGSKVTIVATAHDPDLGDTLTAKWTVTPPLGSTAVFSDPSSLTTSFTPDVVGIYQLTLRVTDPFGAFASQTFSITAVNTPPRAFIEALPSVAAVGSPLHLNGSGSTDPNGDALTYRWAVTQRPPGRPSNTVIKVYNGRETSLPSMFSVSR